MNIDEKNCAYLFYDTDFRTLTSPMILTIDDYDFKEKFKKSEENRRQNYLDFNGKVGIVSVGKKIQYHINNDGGLNISL